MGAALARLSFASVATACCFPIPIAPSTAPTAGCATAPLRRPSPIGEHLQHDADRRLHREIERWAAEGKSFEHARQILLQTATRLSVGTYISCKNAVERSGCLVIKKPARGGHSGKSTAGADEEVESSATIGRRRNMPRPQFAGGLHIDYPVRLT